MTTVFRPSHTTGDESSLRISVREAAEAFAPNVRYFEKRLGRSALPVGIALSTEEMIPLAENGAIALGGDAGVQRLSHGFEEAVRAMISGDLDISVDSTTVREYLRRRGIRHTIPEKTDSQAARLRKGTRGGRPPGFDEDRYKKRNTVERGVKPPKQYPAGDSPPTPTRVSLTRHRPPRGRRGMAPNQGT
ncbi:hypothetical protein ACFQ79_31980, partial [Streptomyces sp. NPDC056480]